LKFDGNSSVRDHVRLCDPVPEVNFQRGEQILKKYMLGWVNQNYGGHVIPYTS